MIVNTVNDVNEALLVGLWILDRDSDHYTEEQSRNGPVRVAISPVMTVTRFPLRRVLFCPARDANPFFHFMEAMWMLGGRNDLPWLAQFNKQMASYSDDGGLTQPAAYGHRWRNYFGYDQLELVIRELKERPDSRRAVLAMWNAGGDRDNSVLVGTGDMVAALNESADVPCNTHCYFRLQKQKNTERLALDMTVCCRSNDILWGAHGANAVHFSVLQEYLAAKLDADVGRLYQLSNNYHLYPDALKWPVHVMRESLVTHNHYDEMNNLETPLFSHDNVEVFDRELPSFLRYADPDSSSAGLVLSHPALTVIGLPMLASWRAWKSKNMKSAVQHARNIKDGDWQIACEEWMRRRIER